MRQLPKLPRCSLVKYLSTIGTMIMNYSWVKVFINFIDFCLIFSLCEFIPNERHIHKLIVVFEEKES